MRFLFTWDPPVRRGAYLATGLALTVLKLVVDASVIYLATGHVWTPLDYLQSAPDALNWRLWNAPAWLLPALLTWTLPFIWVGVTMSARRAIDAGWSGWLCVIFFVPYLNYVLMLALSVAPSVPPTAIEGVSSPRARGSRSLPDLLVAATTAVVVALAMVWTGVLLLHNYGAGVFFGTPFVTGIAAGYVLNRRVDASPWDTAGAVLIAFAIAGGVLLLVAFEGVVCLMMALPLAVPAGVFGGYIGREIARGRGGHRPAAAWSLLALPLIVAPIGPAERVHEPTLHEVSTAIVIAAPAEVVWPHVIAFPPLPPPDRLAFRLGIAYPIGARIDGEGVGAIRRCLFSTGAFVEPITAWQPNERLAFDVTTSPAPLQEWSPYGAIQTPHLTNVLRSRRGEFVLTRQGDGSTRLEGHTWYQVAMGPEGYWQVWSDRLIHQIHVQVLEHIKRESERGGR